LAGRWLDENVGTIDLVVCSPARRARETCALVVGELATAPEVRVEDRLYPGSPSDIVAVVGELPDGIRTVLLVGHNPGLEELVEELATADCVLKTSSIAVLSGPDDWAAVAPGWATLDAEATPRP
jgi:phosphohistidine phosphatase